MELILAPLWTKMLALQKTNIMQLMMRPPKEAVRKDWENQATQTRHAPIILEAGTSSYLDNHKIVENVRANRLGEKSVIACDMQTFIRLWWVVEAQLSWEIQRHNSVGRGVPWHGSWCGWNCYFELDICPGTYSAAL